MSRASKPNPTVKPRRIRILPVLVLVLVLSLFSRAGDLREALEGVAQARAQETQEAGAGGETAEAEEAQEAQAAENPDSAAASPSLQASPDQEVPRKDPLMMSRSELEILDDLARRREELDTREQNIELRENMLAATESRIDEKISQLQTLESEIEGHLARFEELESEELNSIVRVYETMKPKDAARIFERLDMVIQIAVATRMKERSMAPILAEMTPEGAQKLTAELAMRTELPEFASLSR